MTINIKLGWMEMLRADMKKYNVTLDSDTWKVIKRVYRHGVQQEKLISLNLENSDKLYKDAKNAKKTK